MGDFVGRCQFFEWRVADSCNWNGDIFPSGSASLRTLSLFTPNVHSFAEAGDLLSIHTSIDILPYPLGFFF
jgi:hypothetical protein